VIEPLERRRLVEFFEAASSRFEAAGAKAGLREFWFKIAGQPVRTRFAGEALAGMMTPALEHLATAPALQAALTVSFFDSESTTTPMCEPPWTPDCYGPKGEITGYNDDRIRTAYQPGIDLLHTIDRQRGEAIYWAPSFKLVPWWEMSFPMRTILHWWALGQPVQPVHAGAVGLPSGGVLIAGKSGTGKSTSTLACLNSELLYGGDDYVMIRNRPEPFVHSLYSTAKIEPYNLERFPELSRWLANPDRLTTEKAMFFLNRTHPEKLTPGFPVRAIVIPRVTGLPYTTLKKASPIQALTALAPTTIMHLPGASDEAFEKMREFVFQVPCYTLEAGTELAGIPEAILGLLKRGV